MDKMKKALMIIAMVAIIAITGSMIYYFVFFRVEKDRSEIRLQEQRFELEKEKHKIEVEILELQRKKLEKDSQPFSPDNLTFEQQIELINAMKK